MDVDDYASESDDFEVWYECRDALSIFVQCNTQWNVTMNGLQGINYLVALEIMKLESWSRKKKKLVLEEIGFIEQGALTGFNENKE